MVSQFLNLKIFKMIEGESYIFSEQCEGNIVPSAEQVTIFAGTEVSVTQFRGNTATVYYEGNLIRIPQDELHRLGLIEKQVVFDPNKQASGSVDMEVVWEKLGTCYDPEIPVSIVELGLIYECRAEENLAEKKNTIIIKMTLTAPGCSMGDILIDEVKKKVYQIDNVTDVDVELVFEPPWDKNMLSDAAKLQLGMF